MGLRATNTQEHKGIWVLAGLILGLSLHCWSADTIEPRVAIGQPTIFWHNGEWQTYKDGVWTPYGKSPRDTSLDRVNKRPALGARTHSLRPDPPYRPGNRAGGLPKDREFQETRRTPTPDGLGQPNIGIGQNPVAIGPPNIGVGRASGGIGPPNVVIAQPTIGIGQPNVAIGQNPIAIGQRNAVIGQPTIGIGKPNAGLGPPNTGIGPPNVAIGQPTIGIGKPAEAFKEAERPPRRGPNR